MSVPAAVVLLATLAAAATDLWKFKIHNVLTLPLILGGLIYHGVDGGVAHGWGGAAAGLGRASLGMAVGFGVLFPFFALGGKGGGDVKLMAGIGAWLGWQAALVIFLLSSLAVGIYAIGLLVLFGGWRETLVNFRRIWKNPGVAASPGESAIARAAAHPHPRRRMIPFGLMIALAVLFLILPWSGAGHGDEGSGPSQELAANDQGK